MVSVFLALYALILKWAIFYGVALSTSAWLIFEIWLIGSFFWAYIDEYTWQLPKPLERIFLTFWSLFRHDAKENIRSINHRKWAGLPSSECKNSDDIKFGRIGLVSFGLIGRIVLTAFVFSIIIALWPIFLTWATFYLLLRSLRWLRRSQKTAHKVMDYIHKHKKSGELLPVKIERPQF